MGILSFALGFLVGLPSFLLLFYNGLILGAFTALFHSRGLGGEVGVVDHALDAEGPGPLVNCPADSAVGDDAERAPADPVDRLPALPAPHALAGRPVVLRQLSQQRQPQRNGVIGDLLGAVIAHVGDQDALGRGRRNVDDVDADAVAGDHSAALHPRNGVRADIGILVHDRGAIGDLVEEVGFRFGL